MPNFSGIWTVTQQMQAKGASTWPTPPGAPTIGTATGGNTSASITFTAPSCTGYPAGVTEYQAISTPGCFTNTGASSPIVVSGLTNGTAYTFRVRAQNTSGYGDYSAASNSVTPALPLQVAYTTPGTYTFVAPAGLSPATVSVLVVGGGGSGGNSNCSNAFGGGGGGGGGLRYSNGVSVTACGSYTVVVGAGGVKNSGPNTSGNAGGQSSFNATVIANGGGAGLFGSTGGAGGGGSGGTAGYTGGAGGTGSYNGGSAAGGGGGAAGYAGNGGAGGTFSVASTAGSGGGGGGGGGSFNGAAGGGGIGLLGQGCNGSGGTFNNGGGFGGLGGSGGTNAPNSTAYVAPNNSTAIGGGSGGDSYASAGSVVNTGGNGAVRIIYSTTGVTRSFPSTNTGNL